MEENKYFYDVDEAMDKAYELTLINLANSNDIVPAKALVNLLVETYEALREIQCP